MGRKLYVGNLSYNTTDESLTDMFSQQGQVDSVRIVSDRDSGRSKGFAFIEMSTESEAQNAIEKLNGVAHDGRAMNVSEAKPMAPRNGSNDRNNSHGGYSSRSRY